MKSKKGFFSFKALAKSVSGIVAIIGAFVIWMSVHYNRPDLLSTGIGFVIAGLVAAVLITLIMKIKF